MEQSFRFFSLDVQYIRWAPASLFITPAWWWRSALSSRTPFVMGPSGEPACAFGVRARRLPPRTKLTWLKIRRVFEVCATRAVRPLRCFFRCVKLLIRWNRRFFSTATLKLVDIVFVVEEIEQCNPFHHRIRSAVRLTLSRMIASNKRPQFVMQLVVRQHSHSC